MFKWINGHYERFEFKLESDGSAVHTPTEVCYEADLINLTDLLGMCAYMNKVSLDVYDFSSSHLCMKQLELVKVKYEALFRR
ncbi:MAG: hypothetical protein ACI4NC_06335 [Succinivibrio sp.]